MDSIPVFGDDAALEPDEDGNVFYPALTPFDSWKAHVRHLHEHKVRWQERASCNIAGANMYPTRAERQVELAEKMCSGCPVRTPCLELALVSREDHGVWGGLTEKQRREVLTHIAEQGYGSFSTEWSEEHVQFIEGIARFLTRDEKKILQAT